MRRRDREETRREEIINIIAAADCCRLGLIDDDGLAYSVPLNFAFVEEGDFGIFYFHGAAQGKKIDLVNRSLRASLKWIHDINCCLPKKHADTHMPLPHLWGREMCLS